jgi:hypothetical protein
MFLFKMFVHGDGSQCDLMKRMQLKGNFQTAWIMFGHVKHVEGWMIFTFHVYDYLYCKVMTISYVICTMKTHMLNAYCGKN